MFTNHYSIFWLLFLFKLQNIFNFSGTYIGTTEIIPFVIINKGVARAKVEFNLKDFPVFSMDFKGNSGTNFML